MMSVVVPVYGNQDNIAPLIEALEGLNTELKGDFEAVFVVDGSPDNSELELRTRLPSASFEAQLLSLARNFGAFSAIRAGLEVARGERITVMAADLQEPPDLVLRFDEVLRTGDFDVAVGLRRSRQDPLSSKVFSAAFWWAYKRFVQKDIPDGGVDVFGCTSQVRDHLVALEENNSSLVGLLFWVGFRREFVPYDRRAREIGVSAWTMKKKLKYLADSIFSFTDLPIRMLMSLGMFGLAASVTLSLVVLLFRLLGFIEVPGYTATVLVVVFFGALNSFGLGVIGSYVWRTFENTKRRANYIVASKTTFEGKPAATEAPAEAALVSS